MVRALLEQVTDAGRLIWKTLLKPDQRAATRSRQRYHRMSSMFALNTDRRSSSQIIEPPDAQG
jgi:hypothetical protein